MSLSLHFCKMIPSLKDDLNAEILSLKEADALAKEVNEICQMVQKAKEE